MMLLSHVSSSIGILYHDDSDDDDDPSVWYSKPPLNKKGIATQTDNCVEDDDTTSLFGNKKRKLIIIDDDEAIEQTHVEKEQLKAKRGKNLALYDQDLIFPETLFEEEQLKAKKGKSLAISDDELIFPQTLFEEAQLEAKKWALFEEHPKKLRDIDNKKMIFVDKAKKVRKGNIHEVDVRYSEHEKDNLFGELGAIKVEALVEKDQSKEKREGKFDIDAELQLIYSFPEIYLPESDNSKFDLHNVSVNVSADDAAGDDEEVIITSSSSKGKGILVENDPLRANKGRTVTLDDDDDDDDEVQIIYSCPKIYAGKSSKSKHESETLLEKVGVNDATGDLSLLIMCEICADEKPKIEFLTVMGCDHSYCSECVARYVASKLQENVVEITCPVSQCAGVLGPEHCRSILPAEVYDRWGLALCEEIISPSQKFYCPYKDCSALMIDDTQETREVITRMECPNCQRMFCVKCKVPWHNGVECEDFQRLNEDERGQEDIMLVNLAKKDLWKRCPKCKMYVQRSVGCNAMRCRCGCDFCYACGSHARTCHCPGGYAHRLPPEGYAPTLVHRMRQTLTNAPVRFPQGQVGDHSHTALRASLIRLRERRQYLLDLSANQTQYNPSIHIPRGPVGGDRSASQARQGPVVDDLKNSQDRLDLLIGGRNNSEARQDLVGGDSNNSHARQGPVGGLVNVSQSRQGPVEGGRNNSQARELPVGGGFTTSQVRQQRRQMPVLMQNQSANQTRSTASILPLQGLTTSQARHLRQMRAPMILQNFSANETQPNPSSQFAQGSVGGLDNTSQARQLRRMRMQMPSQDLSLTNQTQPNPSSQFAEGHVEGRDIISQAMQREQMQSQMMTRLQNLSGNQTFFNADIQPAGSSVASINESIRASSNLPGTSHVNGQTPFSQESVASNRV